MIHLIHYYIQSKTIDDIVVPPQIKYIKYASLFSPIVKSITFPINSQLKSISSNAFKSSSIQKLILPAVLKTLINYFLKILIILSIFKLLEKINIIQ